MIIFVDIDKTICTDTNGHYGNAKPLVFNINKINYLFDRGHTIVYWTARGSATGKDWKNLTEKQLKEWNAKHHTLLMGKPFYDILIDDKACTIEDINYVVHIGNGK